MSEDQTKSSDVDTSRSRPDAARGPEHDVPTFVELVDGIRMCMFTTVDADGTIISRPMAVQGVDDDATIWFFSYADAPKLDQLAQRPQVNLVFADGDTWISASGTAAVVDDQAKKEELWNPFTKAWFQGAEGDDPAVALIRVDLTGGEFWDAPSKPAQMIGLVKGLMGHGTPADGDNAKLDLG